MNSVFEIHKEVNRFRFFLVSFHQVETLATHLAYRITPLIWPLTYKGGVRFDGIRYLPIFWAVIR